MIAKRSYLPLERVQRIGALSATPTSIEPKANDSSSPFIAKKIDGLCSPARPLVMSSRTGVWFVGGRYALPNPPVDDVVGKGGPVVLGRGEALGAGCKVFCCLSAKPTIVFGDGSPFLEGLDVRDDVALGSVGHSAPSGRRIPSMIARFCASLMPAEYSP